MTTRQPSPPPPLQLVRLKMLRSSEISEFAGKAALVLVFSIIATAKVMAIESYLHSPQPDGLELACIVANLAFVMLVLAMAMFRLGPQASSDGSRGQLTALAGTFLPLLILALPVPEEHSMLRGAGLVLTGVGWTLSALVMLWLGRSFSVTPQARRLVTSGPYSIVRHPLYLTEEIAFLGIVLVNLSAAAVALAAVHWLFQLRRMANEERVLSATFPEYSSYSARIPRLIPSLSLLFRLRIS